MKILNNKLDQRYKGVVVKRIDDNGSLFYFKPTDFDGLITEDFSFKTEKGHTLRGRFYHYGSPKPNRLIVFEHGMGVGHRAYYREIERIAREGYLVYSYDHTGCTESDGEHIMGLSGSIVDLDACICALVSYGFDEKNISVIGHSWGGFSTMNILSFHPDLKNVVALSGFISVKDMQRQVTPVSISMFRPYFYKLEKEMNPNHYSCSAIDTLSRATSPALIIHSMDDPSVHGKRHFLKLQKALGNKENVTFVKLHGKGHNPTYTEDAVKYKDEFMAEHKRRIKEGIPIDTDEHRAFLMSYDWHRMTNQDENVWRIIFDFFEK